ncbi:MAG: type II secretion system F family protein [Proteobacteria bacterium]|nr:type II secretion system F family protein [Pseudomonadota bacterium]
MFVDLALPCAIFCAVSVTAMAHQILHTPPQLFNGGVRELARNHAVKTSFLARRLLPPIEALAQQLPDVPAIQRLTNKCDNAAKMAANPWGMGGKEVISASLLSALLGGVVGALIVHRVTAHAAGGWMMGALFGGVLPYFRFSDISKKRFWGIHRDLPSAIDMLALSMQAGLDFTRSLHRLTLEMHADNPLRFELALVLDRLALGLSRQESLKEFYQRVPIQSVRDFVGSVVQSEIYGTPLKEALTTQAHTMRTMRSQQAEQTASRAAILLLGPLMLIFLSVFLLLLGPFIIKGIRGELF